MENENLFCLNCNEPLETGDHFCHHCGQKTNAHLLSVKELLSNFWNSLFNFDNTIFRTLINLWRPWKLTQYYISGKRVSFLNPMRLFIVTLLLLFTIIVSLSKVDNQTTMSIDEYNRLERSKLYEHFLAIRDDSSLDDGVCIFADTVENKLFSETVLPELDTFGISGIFNYDEFPITRTDAIELRSDSLFSKYNVTSFKDKFIIKQMIRLNLDRAGMIKHGVHNAAWGVFLGVFILALVFKLLYRSMRQKYVVHLVSLLNVHSFCFVVISLSFLSYEYMLHFNSLARIINIILLLFLPTAFFLNLYYTYHQSFIKTFFKFTVIGIIYIMIGFSSTLSVGMLSLLFF